jgi:magnesium transporter
MNIIHYHEHSSSSVPVDQLAHIIEESHGVTWVDMAMNDAQGLQALTDIFHFHPLTLEDVQHRDQRPKAEEFADYVFLILNPLQPMGAEHIFREISVFVGKNYLVTVHEGNEPTITNAQRRLDPGRVAFELSSTYLLYVLMDTVVDEYMPVLEQMENELDLLETRALRQPGNKALNDIFRMKRMLNQIWWVVFPQHDVISVLANHDMLFANDRSHYYLRDISDHLQRITNTLQSQRDSITGLVNLYASSVSNQLNIAVNRLTRLTIGIGIVTVYAGFYGMNFLQTWPPFEAEWGVPMVIALMLVTTVIAVYWMARRDRLDR